MGAPTRLTGRLFHILLFLDSKKAGGSYLQLQVSSTYMGGKGTFRSGWDERVLTNSLNMRISLACNPVIMLGCVCRGRGGMSA